MILVTGGAGFIGSALVHGLNKAGIFDIIIVDRLGETSKWKNLRGLKYKEYIHADDLFTGEYDDQISEVSFIYHLGACSSTTMMNMDYLMKNNLGYSQALFRFAASKNIPFLYASSAATYGDGEQGYVDDESRLARLQPLNPYGYSKQLFDEWVIKEKKKPDLWFGFKFFNVFGPNEYHKDSMQSLVVKAYDQIMKTGSVKLFKSHKEGFKDGEQLRDFIYVKDVVKAMLKFSDSEKALLSGIYNLGTGKARSFYDLVKATFEAMEKECKVEFIDMPLELRDQYQYYTQADMQKFNFAQNEFVFAELEDAVSDYVRNYLAKANRHL